MVEKKLTIQEIADKVYPLFAEQMDYMHKLDRQKPYEGCPESLISQMLGTQMVVVANMFKILYVLTDSDEICDIIRRRYEERLR